MGKLIKTNEYKKSAAVMLSMFFIVRALLISSDSKIGIKINPISFSVSAVNAVYILFVIVFGIFSAYTLTRVLRKIGISAVIPTLLIIADPLIVYVFDDCINIFLGILLEIYILNFIASKPLFNNTFYLFIFTVTAALLSPMSLFIFMPVMFAVSFFGNGKMSFIPTVVSAVLFALFSLVHRIIFENSFKLKIFLNTFSFNDTKEFSPLYDDASEYFSSVNIISFCIFLILTILFLILKNKSNKEKNRIKKYAYSEIIFVIFFMIFSFIGAVIYNIPVPSLSFSALLFILGLKNNESFSVKAAQKINGFFDRHYFILVLILSVLSYICITLKVPGSIFISASTKFM